MPGQVIRVTLSGTFRKDNKGLRRAYDELVTCGCQVLSPHRLDFQSDKVLFVKDSAESDLSDRTIEQHHLTAIKQSDFVWLHAPEGYVGRSAAFEIGYAFAHNIPVFCRDELSEQTLDLFVTKMTSVYDALSSLAPVIESNTTQLPR
jgi:nucleoside 2-deoxyribosyltransferase